MTALEIISAGRIVAILRLDDLTRADALVRSLLEGGIRAIEFTLTNPDAPRILTQLLESIDDFRHGTATLGIGSVRNESEARMAIESGAQFLVSPILNQAVIEIGRAHRIPVFPGALTPTEIHHAWTLGADAVKVFPVKSLGPGYIRDCLAPMPYLRLMPTGGIHQGNLVEYLNAGAMAVGVGSSLVDESKVQSRQWKEISRAASEISNLAATCPPVRSIED